MHIFVRSALVGLFLAAPVGALADDAAFIMSSGVEVPTPPIETLDCDAMLALFARIDATGYRRGASAPPLDTDLTLLIYENRLARKFYADCVRTPWPAADAEGAFHGGYDGDGGSEESR